MHCSGALLGRLSLGEPSRFPLGVARTIQGPWTYLRYNRWGAGETPFVCPLTETEFPGPLDRVSLGVLAGGAPASAWAVCVLGEHLAAPPQRVLVGCSCVSPSAVSVLSCGESGVSPYGSQDFHTDWAGVKVHQHTCKRQCASCPLQGIQRGRLRDEGC